MYIVAGYSWKSYSTMNTINKTSIFRPEAYKTWFRRSLFSPLFRVHYRSNVVVFILDNQCATTSGGSSRFLETRRTNNNDCPDHGIPDTGQFSVFFRYSEFFFQFFFLLVTFRSFVVLKRINNRPRNNTDII